MSVDRTLPQIKQFIENGGTVIAIGSSATNLAAFLNLPIENHLVENGQPLAADEVLRAGFGAPRARGHHESSRRRHERADRRVLRQQSRLDARRRTPRRAASSPSRGSTSKTPLRSGWAWGQAYLEGGVIAVDARVGKGRVLLFGAEILQRAQPHGTFKFLFNAIYLK